MARKKGKFPSRYLKGRVDEGSGDLGTLAKNAAQVASFDEVVDERTKVSSVIASWAIEDMSSQDGPIEVGLMHGDYTAAELEEFIENAGSWNESDLLQSREVAKRLIRSVGMMTGADARLNDGKPIRTKLNWILNEGQTLDLWVYNHGDALTTGAELFVVGHANLWPQ